MTIRGEQSADYFVMLCDGCNKELKCEYLGFDPGVPHFRATCGKCGTSTTLKLSVHSWRGLPVQRSD